uniref:Uncharacterized protein n=1 Tax=Chromera velia CCMP2878 TaxID=1169474 RepID=A0A0K6S5Z4_9ALVE|eukprot:Cvel_2583.t2-p1 / transcript=Cvel_2583.t2 / gene=Cvel_2583 / organism=Chromera_velia_CCMP2878 / gene_product=hypothetical protein / transcript_product=hypothetical protein / location=Cvel_scaffold102:77697-77933(+) / protein_length=79 / sequence_SO=supercontig / SO=protein_coding / is_pseudo=false
MLKCAIVPHFVKEGAKKAHILNERKKRVYEYLRNENLEEHFRNKLEVYLWTLKDIHAWFVVLSILDYKLMRDLINAVRP